MIIRYKKGNLITAFIYGIYIISYLTVLIIYGMGTSVANIRYYLLFGATILAGLILLLKKEKNKIYGKSILTIVALSMFLLIMSYIKAKSVGMPLAMRTYIQISLILLPALYSFELINLFSIKSINRLMKFTLFILIIMYMLEPKHNIIQFLSLKNWLAIDFFHSISFTESNVCSESFLQLFLFFLFFSDAQDDELSINKKNNKICLIISLIFTILSFKRLGVVFAIIMIFVKKFVDIRAEISKKYILVLSIVFTLLTYFYTKIMMGQMFNNIDLFSLTTGRNYILSLWEAKNYFSYGYGTSLLVINRYLEMDLLQVLLELNIISVFIFCFCYFRVAKKSLYSFLIMFYAFSNMLTASSLPYSLGWILLFITVFCISSDKCEDEGIKININYNRYKKLFQKKL